MKTTNLPPTAHRTDVAIRQVQGHGGKPTITFSLLSDGSRSGMPLQSRGKSDRDLDDIHIWPHSYYFGGNYVV